MSNIKRLSFLVGAVLLLNPFEIEVLACNPDDTSCAPAEMTANLSHTVYPSSITEAPLDSKIWSQHNRVKAHNGAYEVRTLANVDGVENHQIRFQFKTSMPHAGELSHLMAERWVHSEIKACELHVVLVDDTERQAELTRLASAADDADYDMFADEGFTPHITPTGVVAEILYPFYLGNMAKRTRPEAIVRVGDEATRLTPYERSARGDLVLVGPLPYAVEGRGDGTEAFDGYRTDAFMLSPGEARDIEAARGADGRMMIGYHMAKIVQFRHLEDAAIDPAMTTDYVSAEDPVEQGYPKTVCYAVDSLDGVTDNCQYVPYLGFYRLVHDKCGVPRNNSPEFSQFSDWTRLHVVFHHGTHDGTEELPAGETHKLWSNYRPTNETAEYLWHAWADQDYVGDARYFSTTYEKDDQERYLSVDWRNFAYNAPRGREKQRDIMTELTKVAPPVPCESDTCPHEEEVVCAKGAACPHQPGS